MTNSSNRECGGPAAPGRYHGWSIVGTAFLVAMFGWGLGFYGPGIYLLALQARHGWSATTITPAITTYYLLGATLILFAGRAFERFGARRVVGAGAVAMAGAVALLALAARPWHVYAAFALMSPGWAAMSGAAINILVAPWFEARRGLAVSLALNGASVGGVVVAPLLILAVERFGIGTALPGAALAMLAVLLPTTAAVLRPRRAGEHDRADAHPAATPPAATAAPAWRWSSTVGSIGFCTISLPFALGLTAQVGILTHQIAYLAAELGAAAAGWTVSLTTACAVAGRVGTGLFVDRIDRRLAACGNFCVQLVGTALLAWNASPAMLYAGCVLFGLGVGNMISLPGPIIQQEFPKPHFARVVGMVVAINQMSFAFGPTLLAGLERTAGGYRTALLACLVMQATAAIVVVLPALARARHRRGATSA